jgi:hypothetical protein
MSEGLALCKEELLGTAVLQDLININFVVAFMEEGEEGNRCLKP